MESDSTDTEAAWQTLASSDEWVLVQAPADENPTGAGNCMLMWLPSEIPNNLLLACQKLAAAKNLVAGMDLQFVQEPSAGFLIFPQKGWSIQKGAEAQNAFDKLMWELDRLRRA